jgi:polysaccharide pyruvyl transferase CsaB
MHMGVQYAPPNGRQRAPLRILILSGDFEENLGDAAILAGTCRSLEALRPGVEISVAARDARRVPREPAVRSVPRGLAGLPALAGAARRADLILCGGGGLFQDDDSLVKMPYWALRVAFARVLCPRVVGWSLGVGPLRARVSRWLARFCFACMESISVRDAEARALAQSLTSRPVQLVPDPALLLAPAPDARVEGWLSEQRVPQDGRPLVGVALRRWFPPHARLVPNHVAARFRRAPAHQSAGSQRLIELVARALHAIVEKWNAHILLLPSYSVPHEGDVGMCEEVLRRCPEGSAQLARIDDAALYKGVVGRLSVLIGGRMHPTIFAAAMGVPVVGLAYNPKFAGFLALIGREDCVLDVERFVREERDDALVALVGSALDRRTSAAARCAELAEHTRVALARIVGEAA